MKTVLDIRSYDDARSLIAALQCLVDCVENNEIVYVRPISVALRTDGKAFLIEETLSDGSKVHDIELHFA